MTKTIVNLTLPAVTAAVGDVLETYPHDPHQQAFSIHDLRQELIAHVLSRVSSCYTVLEEGQKSSIRFDSLPSSSLKEQLCIESVIREGIEKILHNREQEVNHQVAEELDSGLAPSHWFG
jgi:hypothetical protein